MFDLSSKYYDVIYSFKNYQQEANMIHEYLIKQENEPKLILDVACGTGQHAYYLKQHYSIDGIDLNPEFVSIAKAKNPEGQFYTADMSSFKLEKTYDVVMCLFSSIGYVKTLDNVVRTLEQFKEHLNEAGVILVEPWFTPEVWNAGRVDTLTAEQDGIKMCRMSYTEKHDRMSVLRFDYLFGSKAGIDYFSETHDLGLFSVDEMIRAFHDAKLEVEYDEQGISGRGMYIARRKPL
ncbi:class I SAM-dependent DNA methyltransferase [Paenibacillus puldeungensis]|uniref:Class I SAM-dependent DNA methyltransferase n=1 Tax=Paenibacillus puldeungensis TaxID=696536 RepID=A0ABW3RZM1_9BACL